MSLFLVVANASDQQIADTIESAGAEIVSAYEPTVLVVDGGDSVRQSVLALQTVSAVSDLDGTIDVSALSLDDDTVAAVDAWNGRFDPDLAVAKADRFRDGEPWDAPGGSFVDVEGEGDNV
jgi:hypothetical protein